jgi:hypothetical protein
MGWEEGEREAVKRKIARRWCYIVILQGKTIPKKAANRPCLSVPEKRLDDQ